VTTDKSLWLVAESTPPLRGSAWEDRGNDIEAQALDNCWYYLALDTAVELPGLSGVRGDVAGWKSQQDSIKATFDRVLWNSAKNEYRSPGDTDDRTNALAVVSGLAPASRHRAVTEVLRNHLNASPCTEFYVLEALYLMGTHHRRAADAQPVRSPGLRPACYTLWELWHKTTGTDNPPGTAARCTRCPPMLPEFAPPSRAGKRTKARSVTGSPTMPTCFRTSIGLRVSVWRTACLSHGITWTSSVLTPSCESCRASPDRLGVAPALPCPSHLPASYLHRDFSLEHQSHDEVIDDCLSADAPEDRLGALGPALNAAVLWTTRYLDASVAHLRALPAEEREHDVLDEDVARVSPLKHADLNSLGCYSFAARPPREGLRPLRDSATVHLGEDDDTEE
jgi:hypothetical protein